MTRRRLLLMMLLFCWFSVPGSEAVRTAQDISGHNLLKVLLRAIIVFHVLCAAPRVFPKTRASRKWFCCGPMAWIWLYLFVGGASVVVSANRFVSAFRWFDLLMIVCFCTVLLDPSRSVKEVSGVLKDGILASAILLTVVALLGLFSTDWGAKASGFDADQGEMAFRMGGSFLRTDLVAGLGLMLFLFAIGYLAFSHRVPLPIYYLFVLSSFVLLRNQTRSAIWIGLVVAGGGVLVARARPLLQCTALVLAAMAAFNSSHAVEVLTRNTPIEALFTLNSRTYIWKTLVGKMLDLPISFVIGNGYSMNGPTGLQFYVPEMDRYMTSPHSGYVAVLLGTGFCGILCVGALTVSWFRIRKHLSREISIPTHLAVVGAMLYATAASGVWGTTSPELALFILLFMSAARASSLTTGIR